MKNLKKRKFYFGLQIEYFTNKIFVHQSIYTKNILIFFYMDKAHSLSTPILIRSFDINKDPLRPHENDVELVSTEIQYLNAINTLIYLASNCGSDMAFTISLLARFNSSSTQ